MNAHIRFSLCATAMVLFAGTLHAGWTSPTGDPVADNEAMRSTGLFGAQLVLTTDDAALRKNWIATQGPPVLPSTSHLTRGTCNWAK